MMKVCVIGLGYIGFPTACIVAKAGHETIGVDTNPSILTDLKSGRLHIVGESGLADVASEVLRSGRFRVSDRPEHADIYIVSVPTPFRAVTEYHQSETSAASTRPLGFDDRQAEPLKQADLSFVESATRSIAPFLAKGDLVVVESTVPPHTTDGLVRSILEQASGMRAGLDFYLAHAPERVLPGNIVRELVNNSRVVGGINASSAKKAAEFYGTFVVGQICETDSTTAELVKLMENTYRDVNIALANEFSLICEQLGVNVYSAIKMSNMHPRVNILKPGPGVGGHCIAVDPYFIAEVAPEKARIIRLAREINSSMPDHVVDLVDRCANKARCLGNSLRKIVCLGVSYKPDVGDDRESPSYEVIRLLRDKGYQVLVHDPHVPPYNVDLSGLLDRADLMLMLTDHSCYREILRPAPTRGLMGKPWIVDTRGFFASDWDNEGFVIIRLGVGLPRSKFSMGCDEMLRVDPSAT